MRSDRNYDELEVFFFRFQLLFYLAAYVTIQS